MKHHEYKGSTSLLMNPCDICGYSESSLIHTVTSEKNTHIYQASKDVPLSAGCLECGEPFSSPVHTVTVEEKIENALWKHGIDMPTPASNGIEEAIAEFEELFEDKGDKRYGWVAHNNAIVQRQIDWLRTKLHAVADKARDRGLRNTGKAFEIGEVAGFEAALGEIEKEIRHPKHQKPYEEGIKENALSKENKSGWNSCLEYVKEIVVNLKKKQ